MAGGLVFNRADRSLLKLDDNTLTQFKFSPDNQYLIGTSYFTGVSNMWRVGIEDESFDLLSNTETGFFMPYQYREDSLLVLRFYRDGMKPGHITLEVLHEANAINFLGMDLLERDPQVIDWSLPPPTPILIPLAYGKFHIIPSGRCFWPTPGPMWQATALACTITATWRCCRSTRTSNRRSGSSRQPRPASTCRNCAAPSVYKL